MPAQAIFLSYASQDAEAARRICEALRAAGLEVWFDQSELRGGDAWDASIRKQIKECALFVPMISAATNARSEGYFRLEWKLAVDRSHLMADDQPFFLPVILDDSAEPTARVPDRFRERQWSRLKEESAIASFAERVRKLLAGATSPAINALSAAPVLGFTSTVVNTPSQVADEGFWIAVLPFKVRGGSAEIASLAEALSEDIVAGLLHFSYLRVMSRSASATPVGETQDARAIGRELGARYVMEGSLRLAGSTLRVSVQLVDAVTGAHLWAEHYDRAFKFEDMFALQDELVPKIVSTAADAHGILPHAMSEALRSKRPEQLTPYEAVLRSFGYGYRMSREEHAVVRAGLEHAVEVAPAYADAWAMLALLYLEEYSLDFNSRPDPLGRALQAARRATDIAPSNALANNALARSHFFRKEIPAFRVAADRALSLNPFNGPTLAGLGALIAYSGDWGTGCGIVERALKLNPRHPSSYWMALVMNAYRQHDYAGALRLAMNINLPELFAAHEALAAIYGQLGDRAAAGKAVQELMRLRPDYLAIGRRRLEIFLAPGDVEHLMDGMRKAGLDMPDVVDAFATTTPATVEKIDAPDNRPAIAVLPFTNMSANPEDEFFADGLAEELLNVMARIRGLRVAARTSSFSFKGKDADIPTIAAKLNVATVLEGSVRKVGKRIRVTAQLINAADGYHLWSQSYDRELDDIFAVQDDIAQAVVKELQATLKLSVSASAVAAEVKAANKGRSENAEAHRLWLQAKHLFKRANASDRETAIAYYRKALALDPEFAVAWGDLAHALYWRTGSGGAELAIDDYLAGFAEARTAAERALALEPDLPEALVAMAYIVGSMHWDLTGGLRMIRQALTLAPGDAEVAHAGAILLLCNGYFDEALVLARRVSELDPLNDAGMVMEARTHLFADRLAEAEAGCRKAIEMNPLGRWRHGMLVLALLAQQRFDDAERAAVNSTEQPEYRSLNFLFVRWSQGQREESKRLLAEIKEKYATFFAYQLAQAHAWRGEIDEAFAWLETCYTQHDPGAHWTKVDIVFRSLHGDPRWPEMLKKLGFQD